MRSRWNENDFYYHGNRTHFPKKGLHLAPFWKSEFVGNGLNITAPSLFVFSAVVWNYNQLQKHLRHSTVFWLKWPFHDLVLVIPPPPSNTKTMLKTWRNNFEWKGGGRSVLYLTDLWLAVIWSKKGCFFVIVSQHFLNWLKLVVDANARHRTANKPNINFTMNSTFTRLVEQCLFNLGLITSSNPTRWKSFFLSYDDNPN